MENTHIKTIIVGAGPAGITCGYELVKNNQDCLIIDRKELPREKACGGGLTPKAHMLVEEIFKGIKYDYKPIDKINIYRSKKHLCVIPLDKEIRIVERKKFDYDLFKEYEKAGGRFMTDIITKIEERDGKIYLKLLSDKTLSCDYLVGADGTVGIVREYLQPNYKKGILCLEKFVEDKSVNDICISFSQKTRKGYTFCFPNNSGFMVGYLEKKTKRVTFHKMLATYNIAEEKIKGAFIPMYDKMKYPFRKNILLIGDAGGYVDSLTGEGLYYAIKSGENAARAIAEDKEFKELNKPVIDLVKERQSTARLFHFPLVLPVFLSLCKKKNGFDRICRKVNKELMK
ncbi:MAG: NAD(P)/FAD-dependent oxidoreductase [Prevotella sp.]|jgi:geranylgeranyl reductase family protein|nr:NAD(P)/FAD-dependent oxidoreductase [Prevotella sp.]